MRDAHLGIHADNLKKKKQIANPVAIVEGGFSTCLGSRYTTLFPVFRNDPADFQNQKTLFLEKQKKKSCTAIYEP